MDLTGNTLRACVRAALAEDLGVAEPHAEADVTSRLAVAATARGTACIRAKAPGVLAGVACAIVAFAELDAEATTECRRQDGDRLMPGDVVLRVTCSMRALLAAERTALNFLQRLSGVASTTRAFVDAVAGTGARILDTRKTTPGLRLLEKRAVVAGGGQNHRIGLFDQVLLKENHFALAKPASYEDVVRRCVAGHPVPVVAEARDLVEARAAVRGGAAVVLLDNFAPGAPLREAVAAVRQQARDLDRRIEVEASGGVTLATVREFAECGVDRISIGALTHSAKALDLSMLVEGLS
ncbi:MAG: carboxylating nicotinate-nucleotide diphosphorylase [Planctomycetes bacterium]|nr:carboxylating nicotinate-nucleotide diphosphorylase [Planctomycetota bacterium]